MNSNLKNILDSVGVSVPDFKDSQPVTMEQDGMQLSSDPQTIEEALSDDSSLYAAIQEEDMDEAEEPAPSLSPVDEFDSILADAGFSADSPVEEITEPMETHHVDDFPIDAPALENPSDKEQPQEEESLLPESERIPLNSPALLIDDTTSRFSGTTWYEKVQKAVILIAGIGGIGSNLAYQIARLHPASLFLYDDDVVELSNMSGQLFSKKDLGHSKVSAVSDMIRDYTNTDNPFGIEQKFTDTTEAADVMMCGFDSMRARRVFFQSWQKHVFSLPSERRKDCLFLDGRLSIDTLQVFAIRGDDEYNMWRYKTKFLFSDYDADETVCSLKQTTYLACMIAAVMTNVFVNFIASSVSDMPYDTPFFTEYDAQNMIFRTEA